MATKNLCPLCDTPPKTREVKGDRRLIRCVRCGLYEISGTAEKLFPNTPEIREKRYLLSGMARTHYESTGGSLYITTDSYEAMINKAPQNPLEIRNVLLRHLSKNSEYRGEKITFLLKYDYPVTFSQNWEEFVFFLNHLNETGIIDITEPAPGSKTVALTFKGWEEFDRLKTTPIDSNQVFVAMNFDEEFIENYQGGLKPAIKEAGYECFRMDEKHHNKKICEEITYEIKQSKFIVADVTGLNGGVYFEAGYAMALGKEVIWCCREDRKKDDVHFDSRQYNHIFWKDLKDLKEKLKNRILGTTTLGRGKNEVKPD